MVDDFITRSKLGPRLDTGCKQKAEKERNEGDNKNLSLEEITANNREEFGRSARGYVAYLVGATQKLNRFTSDIVRGLGSFDLEVLLVDPVEQAMYCFKQLFSSFRLRGVVDPGEEPVYTEEYLSFIDELRRLHPDVQQPKLLIADTIEFISNQEALKTRRRLTRIFRLCCFCLDEPRFSFPGVRFDSARTMIPLAACLTLWHPYSLFSAVFPVDLTLSHLKLPFLGSYIWSRPLVVLAWKAPTVLGTASTILVNNRLERP